MKQIFQIGSFVFQIDYPSQIVPPEHFMNFISQKSDYVYSYRFIIDENFPQPQGQRIAVRDDLIVYQENDLEMRYIGVKGIEGYYACYQETDQHAAVVYLNPERLKELNIDPAFTSLLALEKRMLTYNEIVLHCAYIKYQGKAILFSAPSETGKTTQANLWEKYKQSQTINGDRSLLVKHQGQWFAQGWPVCGTSEICLNQNIEIKAIVMLSQDSYNHVEKLSPAKAFSLIYSQITINKWNQKDHMHAIDLIEQLIQDIDVYHLGCTISKEAVDCLYQLLYQQ